MKHTTKPRFPALHLTTVCLALQLAASAATHKAASCEHADVRAAVNGAAPGDTVLVPAGSATWRGTLHMRAGIQLIGPGMDDILIRHGVTSHYYLVSYSPTNYSLNTPVRISGFTFDLNNNGPCIRFGTRSKSAPFTMNTKGRIDHNRFINAPDKGYQAIWNYCTVHGVVDNNIFDGVAYPIRSSPQVSNPSWWNSFGPLQFGLAEQNLYFEDNLFTNKTRGIVSDAQFSGRYVFRYNTIYIAPEAHGAYPLFDMHGNQPVRYGSMNAAFGGEIYGNLIDLGAYGGFLLDQRGGRALVFGNRVQAKDNVKVRPREEHDDAISPTTNGVQHVNNSYYWNNWRTWGGLHRIGASIRTDTDWHNGLAWNVDCFREAVPFDGSSGVGCGPLAERPATCTTVGVAYWATDQPCTNPADMVGMHPENPLSGTLYRWTAASRWEAFYTPLPYPHPLRNEPTDQPAPPRQFGVRAPR